MRIGFVILTGVLAITVAGCVTVQKVVRERVDQDISGNKGYLQGSSSEPTYKEKTGREYIDIKVELPTMEEIKKKMPERKTKKAKAEDISGVGNRGYFTGSSAGEETLPPSGSIKKPQQAVVYEYEETSVGRTKQGDIIVDEEEVGVVIPAATTYKVKEGDTLSHIAKKLYGKASKWTIIYEANADKIKDPDRVKPGTVLTIPELKEGPESGYTK